MNHADFHRVFAFDAVASMIQSADREPSATETGSRIGIEAAEVWASGILI
jgi:hypothetical protein